MLRKWVVLPLKEKKAITARLNRVAALFEDPTRLESIIASLKKMGDLERLVSKVATGRINPRELHQLKNSLEPIGPIKTLLADSPEKCLQQLAKSLNDHEDFMHHVTQSLTDAPPMLLHQGNVIREGIDADLDEYRSLAFSGKDYLLGIQKREAESTGITSLKIAYNKVFGYYLEVSNTHKDKVPTGWIRKQTLVNAERYITE
jgi:DNA mismatch repair protein MutS